MRLLSESTCEHEVFFDLDGVLADFDSQIERFFHQEPNAFWDSRGHKEAWSVIKNIGAEFWIDMGLMPGSKQLWSYVKQSGCLSGIITAPPKPSNIDMSYIKQVMKWKTQWVRNHWGSERVLFAYSGTKGKFAKPNRILIDDMDKNLTEWKNKGGIPVEFDNAQSVIKKLQSMGV